MDEHRRSDSRKRQSRQGPECAWRWDITFIIYHHWIYSMMDMLRHKAFRLCDFFVPEATSSENLITLYCYKAYFVWYDVLCYFTGDKRYI